jgi:hypothetical protein
MDDQPEQMPCAEKLAFNTKKEADVAANVAEYQRGIALQSYRCQHCGLWHLSSHTQGD